MTDEVPTPRTPGELVEVFDQVVILYAGGMWTPGSYRACSLLCSWLGIRPSEISSLAERAEIDRGRILAGAFEAKRQMIRERIARNEQTIVERWRRRNLSSETERAGLREAARQRSQRRMREEPVDHRDIDNGDTTTGALPWPEAEYSDANDGFGRLQVVALTGEDECATPSRVKPKRGKRAKCEYGDYEEHGVPVKPKPEPVVKPGAKRRFMMRTKRKGVIPDHD